jgi:hypothetical protein
MRVIRAVVGLVLSGAVLAACGGGGKKTVSAAATTTSGPATTTTVAPTTTTTVDVTADAAKAKQINLQASDLPAGWASTPATPKTAADKADAAQVNTCLGLPAPDEVETANVDSDSFNDGGSQVASSVTFTRSADLARRELAAYTSAKATGCLQQSLNAVFAREAQGATVTNVTLTPKPAPTGGDGGFAYHFTATITAQSQQVQLTADILAVLVGRAEVQLTSFTAGGQPTPDQLQQSLLAKMVARAKTA